MTSIAEKMTIESGAHATTVCGPEAMFAQKTICTFTAIMGIAMMTIALHLSRGLKRIHTRKWMDAKKPSSTSLRGFIPFSNSIFYRAPQTSTLAISDMHSVMDSNAKLHGPTREIPDLVILCTWMGAAPRHIEKYTEAYTAMFPSAPQLVITSSLPDMTYRSHASQRTRIVPAVNNLQSFMERLPNARILLHIFSDGGANTACQLATEIRRRTGGALPATSIILDSTPGSGTYKTCRDAIVNSVPNTPLARMITIPLTHAYLITVWNMETFLRVKNIREQRRRDLSDSMLFSVQAKRLYIYSRKDRIVPWNGVEDHANAAIKTGLKAQRLRFEESGHVGHIQKHGAEYWCAVRKTLLV